MSAPVRLGLAGCGRIAERGYVPAAQRAEEVEIVAVADPDARRAKRVARRAGVAAFGDVDELIGAGGIEALVVVAPAERHLELASLAAAAGLPSLVEKPPASDLDGALALQALEPAPAFAFNRRFLQGRELAPAIPAEGWLELDLELRFQRRGWAAHVSRDEALLDAGVHLIDLAVFLTGSPPIAVRAAEIEPERARLELELGRGRARIRCATDRAYAERVEVRDRGGRTVAVSASGRLRAGWGRLRGLEEPLVGSIRRQLTAFAAVQRGGWDAALADGIAAVEAMATVEAARRSAGLGGAEVTVDVPTVSTPSSAVRVA